jgi:hypothetical protein
LVQRLLTCACALGLLANAFAFGALMLSPAYVEQHVRDAAIALMKRELGTGAAATDDSGLADLLQEHVAQRLDNARKNQAPITLMIAAEVYSQLCHYQCGETLRTVADAVWRSQRDEIGALSNGLIRARAWTTSRYSALVSAFVEELRIFTGANAGLLLLALVGLTKLPQSRIVATVASLVFIATIATAYLYATSQSWLLTFVTADYVGWSYLAWVGVTLSVLLDAAFLQGRLTLALFGIVWTKRDSASK